MSEIRATSSALYNTPHVPLIISGPDARAFLQGQCTSDIQSLQPNHATSTLFCQFQGKVFSSGWVLCANDHLFIYWTHSLLMRQYGRCVYTAAHLPITSALLALYLITGFSRIIYLYALLKNGMHSAYNKRSLPFVMLAFFDLPQMFFTVLPAHRLASPRAAMLVKKLLHGHTT